MRSKAAMATEMPPIAQAILLACVESADTTQPVTLDYLMIAYAARAWDVQKNTIAVQLNNCRNAGWIETSDHPKLKIAGRPAKVHKLTDVGRAALYNLRRSVNPVGWKDEKQCERSK